MSRSQDLVILLGAGASAESGIPPSAMMIERLETLLNSEDKWKRYNGLYNHLKSAIFYSAGLRGLFNHSVVYNIETLVNTLNELERNEVHPIYPFIASWNSRFIDLAGTNFDHIHAFRLLILEKLKDWMCPEDGSSSAYYSGLRSLQQHLNYPLRIFTLNYDLCVESIAKDNFNVETGFGDYGPQHLWDYERFNDSPTSGDPAPEMFLYKLHGSINWKRDEQKRLYQVRQVQSVESSSMELIFGREFKLEAADPYLFYAYEFRRLTTGSRLIVTVGYGFADEHINKLLSQALRLLNGPSLVVFTKTSDIEKSQQEICQILEVTESDRVTVQNITARKLFESADLGETITSLIPSEPDPFTLQEDGGSK